MAGYRYHAYAEALLYPYTPQRPRTWWQKWRERLSSRLYRETERAQVREVFRAFADNAEIGPDFQVTAWAWCINPGAREQVRIGNSVVCRGLIASERFHPGTIIIGDNVYIGDNTVISCAERIEIGKYTMLAHGVQIFDNNSHPLGPDERLRDQQIVLGRQSGERPFIERAPIWIGERSWIGVNAIVLKGVRIGPASVVAAGSVVTGDVAPNTLAAGNPARVIRQLK